MKWKSLLLLLVFCLSLLPVAPVQAEVGAQRPLEDALALLYVSEALLLPEGEVDDSVAGMGLQSFHAVRKPASEADPLLARMIHAKKQERNDLDAAYRLLTAQLRGAERDCEAERVKAQWEKKRGEINAQIGFLHKVRGDRRKALTRIWHSIKRTGRSFWQRIGPVGRNLLRRSGPELLQVVASGGTLNSTVIKTIFKSTARTMVRERIKKVVYEGMERLLLGQLDLARAAGVDLCGDGEVEPPAAESVEEEDCSTDGSWFPSYWDETVYPDLVAEGRNCYREAVAVYRNCLQGQARQGVCSLDAEAACEKSYRVIPGGEAGETISLQPAVLHGGAEEVSTALTYARTGGAVEGSFHYVLHDLVHKCTITSDATITGTYDPATCKMSGTAQIKVVYDGLACPSVCGSGPNSPASCPVTRAGPTTWEATLEDGGVSGGIGMPDCEPGCIGFLPSP